MGEFNLLTLLTNRRRQTPCRTHGRDYHTFVRLHTLPPSIFHYPFPTPPPEIFSNSSHRLLPSSCRLLPSSCRLLVLPLSVRGHRGEGRRSGWWRGLPPATGKSSGTSASYFTHLLPALRVYVVLAHYYCRCRHSSSSVESPW